MGANDAREQLEVCKDEYGKLERENAELRARLAKPEPVQIDREALIEVLTEAWEAKRKEIGRGIAPKGTKVGAGIDAVIAHLAAQPVAGAVEWGLSDSMLDSFPKPHFTGSEESVRWNQRRGHPNIKVVRRTVSEWVEVTDE